MDGCRYSKLKCVGGSNSGRVDSIIELSDDNGVDRISELPDEIIIFILSFLSLREAICTSVLSSRWPTLWKYIPSIKFNTKLIKTRPRMEMPWELRSCDMEKKCEEYIQMVNSVLRSREALSLKEFRLSLYVDKSAECSVARWLEYLFSRQVEILELDFLCQYKMDKVCLGASLRDTKLCLPLTDVVLFKSLKRLCLKSLKASGEDIDLFLCNCPLLEQMSIHKTHLTSDVVLIGTTLMLKHLDIYRCTGHFSVIIFSSPKLTWLRVDTQSNNNLVLVNVPKLIRADFTIRSRTLDDAQDFASAVFCYISRLKFLHLSLDHPKVFLWNGFPQMPKLKRLSIRYSGVYGHGLMPITALIWASPRLKEFNLEFINLARDPTRWVENFTNDTRPPHRHLKTFKFQGFCEDAADHIELVTYISNNCVVLQNIFIS